MAGTKIEYELDDGGSTENRTKATAKLREGLDNVAAAATRASSAAKSAMAASAAPKTSSAIKAASAPTADKVDMYDQARAGGGTGAAGRDFAKQSQGLGGLVRVYATFAANLFAVTAAFTALKEAANTENMVKGLDQLSASGGQSLGSLSKQIAATTGGALSLRDAMTAVAQASSAGLGTQQIQDIAVVAGKASQALGISMTDAVSRLSRGISKIEPELLDELGIFVKVDDATNKYALSVGKTVASLSDFEKRQAFANAVLEQGKQKFSAIEATANPYDKLIASITNLATAGLTLVNKILDPIARLLSESPMALAAVFAYIATVLLKQAIPALGEFRKGFQDSAKEALKAAEAFKSGFGDKFQSILEKRFKIPDLQADIAKTQKQLDSVKMPAALSKAPSLQKLSTATDTDAASLKNANKMLENRNAIIETGMKGSKAATDQQIENAKAERDYIQKTIKLYEKKMSLSTAQAGLQAQADKQGRFHPETLALERYAKLKTKVDQAELVSNAAQNASIVGVRQSWATLNQEIAEKGLKGLDKFSAQARGGLAAVTERISGFGAKIAMVAQAVGVAIAVYEIFNSVASKAAVEQEKLNTKIQEGEQAVKTVNDTFKLYTEKKKDAFSIQGIVAFTTALSGVSKSFDEQLDALNEFRKASGWWDQLKDDIAGVFGKSNTDDIKRNAVSSVQAVMKSLEFSSGGDAAKKGIAAILNLDPKQLDDINALKKATKELDEVGLGKLAKEFKNIEEREQFSTNAAKAFMESLTAIDKIVDQIIQANAFTDLQGKLGVELVNASDKLAQALNDPLKALTDIAAIGKSPKMLAIIGKEDLSNLAQADKLVREISEAQVEVAKAKSEYEKANKTSSVISMVSMMEGTPSDFSSQTADAATQAAQEAYNTADTNLKNLKKRAVELASDSVNLVTKISDEGFRRIQIGLKEAKLQAALTVESAKLGYASAAGFDTSSQEANIKRQELNIQERLINASYGAEMATIENTKILQRLTATQEILAAQQLRAKSGTEEERAANAKLADSMEEPALKRLRSLDAEKALRSKDMRERASATLTYGEDAVKLARASIKSSSIPAEKRDAELAKTASQKEIIALDEFNKKREYVNKKIIEAIGLNKENLSIQLEELNTTSQLGPYMSDSLLKQKEALQLAVLKEDTDIKAKQIADEKTKIEEIGLKFGEEEYNKLIAANTQKTKNLNLDKAAKEFAIETNAIRERGAAIQAKLAQESGIVLERQRLTNSVEEASISNKQAEIGFQLQLGIIDEKTANAKKADYDLQLLKIRSLEEEARIKADIAQKQAALDTAKKLSEKVTQESPNNKDKVDQATKAQVAAQAELDLANFALTKQTEKNTIQKTAIEQAKEYNDKLTEEKLILQDIASLSDSLGNLFGDAGKNLGDILTKTNALAVSQEKYDEKRLKAIEKYGKDSKEVKDLETRHSISQIKGIGDLASSAKKMFGERTNAHKLLAGIEKASQLAALAMQAQQLASYIAGQVAKVGASIPAIYASFMAQLGPWGPPAAAAAIAAFLRIGGGGGGSQYSGPSGADMQKLDGTGQRYEGKQIVETGYGVLGASDQRSDTLTKTQSLLAENSVKSLEVDKSMLKAINNMVMTIGNAITMIALDGNITKGRNFGTMGGTSTIPMGTVDTLLNAAGGAGIGAAIGSLVGPLGTIIGGAIGGVVGAIGGALFGGSTSVTATIEAAGLQFQGTLEDLAYNTQSAINQYKDVLVTTSKDGGLLGSDEVNSELRTELNGVAQRVSSALGLVFDSIIDTSYAVGKKAGVANETIQKAIKSIKLDEKIDLKGLSIDDQNKVLQSLASSTLTQVFDIILPQFKKFQVAGEDLAATVFRVIDAQDKVNLALDSVSSKFFHVLTVEFTQALVDGAGGLKNFVDQANFFTEKFIAPAENLKLVQQQVTKSLTDLGHANITTRDQYRELVQSISANLTPANAELYQSLMNLAPAFDIVASAAEKAQSDWEAFFNTFATTTKKSVKNTESITTVFDKFNQELPSSKEGLLSLVESLRTSSPDAAAAIIGLSSALNSYYSDLESFTNAFSTTSEKTARDIALVNKTFTHLNLQVPKTKAELLDLVSRLQTASPETATAIVSISSALTTFYNSADSFESITLSLNNSLKTTSQTLKSQITTLQDYNNSLLLGENTTLTATEQYNVAKDNLANLFAIIDKAPTNEEETKLRADAISKLGGAKDTYLGLSRRLFADSAQYQSDFNDLRSRISGSVGVLETEKSVADLQLSELQTANTYLKDIKDTSKSTSELLAAYVAAGGIKLTGYAVGTSYVPRDMTAEIHQGERIIPAVDNVTLTRSVVNNSATTQELVNQITELTKQVEELAAVVANGAILNAKATDRNTEEITKVITSSNDKTIQSNRLQARAAIK